MPDEQKVQISFLADLAAAAQDRKSVVVPGTTFRRPCPAAFMMNLQGHVLYRLFKCGMYLVTTKKGENHDEAQTTHNQ